MSKNFIQGLYEMSAGAPDANNGLTKFEEQKLRRALDANHKVFQRNRDVFENNERKFKDCPRYDPCPICDKCRNKASHLYVTCQTCNIPICSHTYENRANLIRRNNFIILVSKETMDEIKKLDEKITGGDKNGTR